MTPEIVIGDGASSDDVIDALRRDPGRIVFRTDALAWKEPVDPAFGPTRTLVFEGLGLDRTNLIAQADMPFMLGNHDAEFALRWNGLTWLGADRTVPAMVDFTYLDRWSWRECGFKGVHGMGFNIGAYPELLPNPRWPAEGWGRASQFNWHRVEAHRCSDGNRIEGARAFSIGGDSSFERNGAADLTILEDTRIHGYCGHGSIRDTRFERDDEKAALVLRSLHGMHVGANRYRACYMDAECNDSTWYADTLIGGQRHRRLGDRNTAVGLDLHLPYHPSGA